MSITWEYYRRRVGTTLEKFLEKNAAIKSYEDLCASLLARGVDIPPPQEDWAALQPPPRTPKATDIFKPKPKPKAKARQRRRPAGKDESLGIKSKQEKKDEKQSS